MSELLAVLMFVCFAMVLVGLLAAIFLSGRRRAGLKALALGFVGVVVTSIGLAFVADGAAREKGFIDANDYSAAQRAKVDEASVWAGMREEFLTSEVEQQEKDRAAELQLKAEADEVAKAKATAEKANELVEKPDELAAQQEVCRSDLVCWGDKKAVWAGYKCPPEIEKLAKYRANWLDGWLGGKFTHYRWLDEETGTLTMIGDSLEFENGFGSGVRMVYECDIDPEAETVMAVRVFEGRL